MTSVRGWVRLIVGVLLATAPAALQAQQPTAARWQLEIDAGGNAANRPTGGLFNLPDPGATRTLGPFSTRQVPSWYFGDGALLFKQSNASHPFSSTDIASLDSMLTTSSAERHTGALFRVSLLRRVSARLGAEFALTIAGGGPRFTPAARAGIEAARASFEQAWSQALAFLQGVTVTSVAVYSAGSARRVLATGAARVVLVATPSNTIDVTAGAGLLVNTGTPPSVSLTGEYRGSLNGLIPYDETDHATIRIESAPRAFVGVLGAGYTRRLNSRWGVRADVRLQLSHNSLSLHVSADPQRVLISDRSHEAALALGLNPVVLIYNEANSVVNSSLSGPGLQDFVTFTGTGLAREVAFTAGAVMRF